MRGWGASVLLGASLVVVSCATSVVARPLSMLPTIGDPPSLVVPPAPRALPQARGTAAQSFPYSIQPEWLPTTTNYDEGRDDGSVDFIVIHYTEISYARTLSAFHNPNSYVSAHYVVRNDGHVAQIVGEADTAWHAGNSWFNDHSVGIEIEKSDESNPDFTPEEYYAAASLACGIAARHDIPLDRQHVIGHNEVPGSTHTDPGPTWGWDHFMYLTSLCAPPVARNVHASFVSETPFPVVKAGEPATVSIVLQNTGVSAWRKGTTQEARIGVVGNNTKFSYLGAGWPAPARPAVQAEDVVPTGSTATFTFTLSSELPGTYVIPLRGVIDGGSWMDDLGMYVVLTVR